MLSLGNFPAQLRHNIVFLNPITQNLHFCSMTRLYSSTKRMNPPNLQGFLCKRPSGFLLNALNSKKKGKFGSSETEGPGDFEDGFDDNFIDIGHDVEFENDGGELEVDDGEFEGDSDDDDDVIIPLQNMKKWLENKPPGFGEGKVYDTSIEDKLMEEIEHSRKAQFDNINKLKRDSVKAITKKDFVSHHQASVQIPNGFRVRLFNLPKKKNIHKDLKIAFKGISGIQNIVPVVSGNEKTRDPVCKGLAFIDFKLKDEAERFVKDFSGRNICFGKLEKQMKCELVISKLAKDEANRAPRQAVLACDSDDAVATFLNSSPGEGDDNEYVWENEEEIRDTSSNLDLTLSEEAQLRQESASSKQGRKPTENNKKAASSKQGNKKNKIPKLTVPGSAKRLKLREKATLTGVFSKYGANAASPTLKEVSR